MAHLIVRNLDNDLVKALKQRAAAHGRSMEDEHRLILEDVLSKSKNRGFIEALMSMPKVAHAEDFERIQDDSRPVNVFD